jgi:putative hemolysin
MVLLHQAPLTSLPGSGAARAGLHPGPWRNRWVFMDDGLRSTVISYAAPEDSLAKQAMIRLIERLSARRRIVRAYEEARSTLRPGDDIWAVAVRSLDITVRYSAEKLAAVPKEGPLVVVANHPFGVVDGLVVCHLVSTVRTDFKVVAMSTLCRVPEVREHVLPINFAGTREAVTVSARSRRAARALLDAGGCLIIFPAGAVSTARRVFGRAVDADWHPFAGRMIMDYEAAVLPIRFDGKNGLLFQLVSRVSPTLRLSLLLQEAARRIGTAVDAHLGEILPYEALRSFEDPKALVDHLRQLTYAVEPERTTQARPIAAISSGRVAGRRRRLSDIKRRR